MFPRLTRPRARFRSIFLLLPLFFFNSLAQAQIAISGKVTNGKGEAIEGASVLEKGSANGSVTHADGSFSLSVKNENSVLVFSHIGFQAFTTAVHDRKSFVISLVESLGNNLNDVVVIGYGERRRKDITGAVSVVTSKDIEKSTSMSPELALQGTAAGVLIQSGGGDPNARPTIRIRGVNTYSGVNDPLYVVDGVPVYEGGSYTTSGGIGDLRGGVNIYTLINPEDVESITVLKDASASAIYGVRASNGVVLITTKKGKAGRPKVEIASYYGIQNIAKKIPVLNTQQYFKKVNEAYNANPDRNGSGNILPIGQSPNYGAPYDPSSPQYGGNNPTTDWVDALLNKNAPIQNHSVRVSGGNESTTYYFSGAYAATESPLKQNNLKRYSLTANVDSKISRFVSAGLTLRVAQEDALTNAQTDLGTMLNSIPFQPIYDKNDPTGFAPVATGVFTANPSYDPTKLSAGADSNFAYTLNYGRNTRFNMLAFQALNKTTYRLSNASGNAYVQIEPIQGLRLKASLGGQYSVNERTTWQDLSGWRFSQTPNNPYANQDGNAKGTLNERQTRTTNLDKELTLTYSHTFARDHNIDVLLGASEEYGRWDLTDISGNVNYTDPQFRSISNVPPYTNGSEGIIQEDATIGYVGRISYKYKDKYYVDVTDRDDGSSRLAPGHRFSQFPSFGVAWRISSEEFFPKNDFINDLKLRGGYGRLGNESSVAGSYQFLSGVSLAPHTSFGSGSGDPSGRYQIGAYLPNFANTSLTWEKLKTTSAGFDAVLFGNHISLTAEYYNKITFGIIQTPQLPPNTGIPVPASLNIGSVRNRGVEIQLGYNTQFGPVDFNVSGNFTSVSNKVLELYGGNSFGGNQNRIEVGQSLGYLWGYKVGGIFQNQGQIDAWRQNHADLDLGQKLGDTSVGYHYQPGDMYFQDLYGNAPAGSKADHSNKADSQINHSDYTYLGKTIPSYYYGFSIGAAYKGFDINVLFQGVGDVQAYNGLRAGLENAGSSGNMSPDVLNSWTTSNHSTSMPRAVAGDPAQAGRFSNRFIEQAGYLRLKNLTIGYSLPRPFVNRLGFIQGFRVYVSSLNLLTVTKWTGYDPEVNSGTPTTRQFLFGVRATF